MAYDPSNPNKYKNQASAYSGSVSAVNSELGVALSELGVVNDTLGFSASESASIAASDISGCKDVLTYNVIASNEEIKSEITQLQSELSTYSGIITGVAPKLDAEEKAEYDRMMARKRKDQSNDTTEETE